jgi:glycosyltransferase involved in cell wall biosynthesis
VRIVIRAKNEAAKIGRTLERLAEQTIADRAEIVVVDSGSTDGTLDIVRAAGARLIEIPPKSFTYGRSLNIGCRDAGTPLIAALSAHAVPVDSGWLERLIEPFGDERVACACGFAKAPEGGRLTQRFVQDAEHARAHPFWGYSNSSGAFRADLWRDYPFREDMPGTEDKEWAWHWLQRGWLTVIDPTLITDHSHSDEGPVKIFRRAQAEWEGFAMYLDLDPYTLGHAVRDWWTQLDGYPSHLRARLGARRVLRLMGRWRGRRLGWNPRR